MVAREAWIRISNALCSSFTATWTSNARISKMSWRPV
jgi:hypothetical protein